MRRTRTAVMLMLALLVTVGTVGLGHPATAAGPGLRVGVGRADLTPPTGYFLQGWVESSSYGTGVNTRLYARVIVLQEGAKKYALVAEDLNGIAGGVLNDAVKLVADRGFTPQNVLDSASHTHGAPAGYYNYTTYNTVFMTPATLTQQNVTGALDPALYAFEVRQLALAIRRADDNLGPGKAAWGHASLLGLTQNRSLEASLANDGIHEGYGQGRVEQAKGGYLSTIDPDVELLRVDKTLRGRDVPVGAWMTFADHGTVNKATWLYYNADHHATADRVVEQTLRAEGHPPPGQDVVSAYGNSDEGDQTAGIVHSGPADADAVGAVEAQAFLEAWRAAGRVLSDHLAMDSRWTRVRFDGRQTSGGGPVGSQAQPGLPLFTGSEEGRGPLYETTGQQFEGVKLPADNPQDPAQGDKVIPQAGSLNTGGQALGQAPSTPPAVPLMVLRLGDRALASVPGEMTVAMGRRLRSAVLAAVGPLGVTRVDVAGLANEYLSYFTTPEEYEEQHYEGGSTMYGRWSSYFILDSLVDLGTRLATAAPDPIPDPSDPVNGVTAAGTAPFGTGATSATALKQPAGSQRLQQALFSWQGGQRGLDLPLDRPFITVRRDGVAVTDDLAVQMYWGVDGSGVYTARWEIPRDAEPGSYDFRITANHYTLTSEPFRVVPSLALSVGPIGDAAAGLLEVRYPPARYNTDITARPRVIDGGRVGGEVISGSSTRATSVPAGSALDRFGNCNGTGYASATTVTSCPALPGAGVAGRPGAPGVPKKGSRATGPHPHGSLASTGPSLGLGLVAVALLLTGAVARRRSRIG
jgi:neutral ceramidase